MINTIEMINIIERLVNLISNWENCKRVFLYNILFLFYIARLLVLSCFFKVPNGNCDERY